MRRRVGQIRRSAATAVAAGLALLLLAGALPAAAQEAPAWGEGSGQTAVFLPLVGAAQQGDPGAGPATEVIEDHMIVLGEELAESSAAKPPPDSAPPDYTPPPLPDPTPDHADPTSLRDQRASAPGSWPARRCATD